MESIQKAQPSSALRFGRRIVAMTALALCSAPGFAQLDRGGNILREDDGGGYSNVSASAIVAYFIFVVVATYIGFKLLEKHTTNSSELNGNIAFFGAIIIGLIAFFLVD